MAPLDLDDNGFGVVITAADANETCQESDELEHDVMIYYALEGMAGPADRNDDGWISAEEVHAWAAPRATEYNPGQHAQIYDAHPARAFNFLDRRPAPKRTVTITAGPTASPTSVHAGGQVACTASATDSLGGTVSWAWSATDGSFDDPTSRTPTWTAPEHPDAEQQVTLTVIASSSAQPTVRDSGTATVTLLPPQQGDVHINAGPSTSAPAVTPGASVDCSVTATDGPGAGLSYLWRARGPSGSTVGGFDDPRTRQPRWTAPAGAIGAHSLTVRVASAADPEQFDTGSVSVRVAPRLAHRFARGVAMVAVPGAIPNRRLGEVLGVAEVAGWDADVQEYTTTDPTAESGRGCWARFPEATDASVLCASWPEDSFSWQLRAGWNMVALPWDASVPLEALSTVPSGSVPQLAWSYGPGGYDLVSALDLAGADEQLLRPWRAWWLFARQDCTATLRRGLATAQSRRSQGWAVRVTAGSPGGIGEDVLCGSSGAELTVPDLPPVEGAPNIAISGAGGALTASLQADGGGRHSWPLTVTAAPGQQVTVGCPDLSGLPAEMRVVLEDRDAEVATSLRTNAAYVFTAGDAPRHLLLRVERRDATLVLSGARAQQAGGTAAAISYTLSTAAEVEAEVMNIAGRTVRRLPDGARTAGSHTLHWNLRDRGGHAVPSGRYLVRVTARTEDGAVASAIAPLQVRR
jgi:hypothetical protein